MYLFLLYFYMQVLPCFIIRLTEKSKKSTQFIEGAYASSIAKHLVEKQEETLEEKKKRLKKRVSVNTISSHRKCSIKKAALKVWQNSQTDFCVGVFSLRQMFSCEFCEIPKHTFFIEHLRVTTPVTPIFDRCIVNFSRLYWT